MRKVKKPKKLHAILQSGYIKFSIVILLLFLMGVFLSLLSGGYLVQQQNRNNFASYITRYGDDLTNYQDPVNNNFAELIMTYEIPFEQVSLTTDDAWLEVLDDQYRTIKVIGNKQTDLMHYTALDLLPNLDAQYSYSIAPFVDDAGVTNILLVAIPSSTSIMKLQFTNYSIFLCGAIFLILIVLLGVLYSKWSARKVTKPLTHITEAIKNSGEDGILMNIPDFSSTVELEEIKNAFNALSQRLTNAKQDRERLLSDRNRMIMDISHDIKTPITTIAGYARALAEDVVTDEETKNRYAWTLYEKSLRVGKLVDDLFTLTKLDVSSDIIYTDCDLVELVKRIMAEHYTELEANHMEMMCELPGAPVVCKIDSQSISRAIANMIENANKYADHGRLLAVIMHVVKDHVLIRICDNGDGIPNTLQEHIFEPFVRGDKSRSVEPLEKGGTGLGLAIAKAAIEKHNGRLELLNCTKEYRTIFQITLPIDVP